jgi:hypothetical protein
MDLRSLIKEYLEKREHTLAVARREAQRTDTPYVVRIYLEKDLGIKTSPSASEREQAIRFMRMVGWTDLYFEDPSVNQVTDVIAVLTLEPRGWPRLKIQRALRASKKQEPL